MIEYEQDDDGTLSCYHRSQDDLHPICWCALSKELCCHSAECRVPIATNLSLLSDAAEELMKTCYEVIYHDPRQHGVAATAAKKAMARVKALLKMIEGRQ